ncbi:MAG: chaperone NapD [Planctomycetota bacterium]|jgi:nitrate reductase NapAB chaperone NapD
MQYSEILLRTPPDRVACKIDRLEALPGVEVHHRHPESGRIVIVQESATVQAQEPMLRRIQDLSDTAVAELVYRYAGAQGDPAPDVVVEHEEMPGGNELLASSVRGDSAAHPARRR